MLVDDKVIEVLDLHDNLLGSESGEIGIGGKVSKSDSWQEKRDGKPETHRWLVKLVHIRG